MFSRKIIVVIVLGSGLFVAIVFAGIWWFGSVDAMIAYIHGNSICLSPRILDLGEQEAGTERKAVFSLKNMTSREMSIVGMESCCGCKILEQLPVKIPPKGDVRVSVSVHFPKKNQIYERYIEFLVAEPNCLTVNPAYIKATVVAQPRDFEKSQPE